MADTETGVVAWFSNSKGFGFIKRVNKPDVFCHFSNILSDDKVKSLNEGDKVEFEVSKDPQGRPQAQKVRKVD